MNKVKKMMKSFMVFTFALLLLIPGIKAEAAASYKIVFKAGKEAAFNSGADAMGTVSADRKTLTIECAEGTALPALPTYSILTVPSDFRILESSSWGYRKNNGTVSRSENIVVQYAQLINGVEYTVRYIDDSTGNNIAAPKIERGSSTTTITETALNITDYQLLATCPNTQTITLDLANPNPVIEFRYEYTGTGGGGTTVITEPGTTTVVTTDGGTETIYQVNEVPTYVSTPVAGGGGAAAGGGAADAGDQAADAGDAGAQIGDGEVPLAGGDQEDEKKGLENDGKDVILEDEEVPKGLFGTGVNPTSVIIASGIGLAIIAGVLFGISRFKKSRITAVSNQEDNLTDK